MKRDLQINFGYLDDLSGELATYTDALDTMESAINGIDALIADSSGKAVKALKNNKQINLDKVTTLKDQVESIHTLLANYREDMTACIAPTYLYSISRTDNNDTYWNILTIEQDNHFSSRYNYYESSSLSTHELGYSLKVNTLEDSKAIEKEAERVRYNNNTIDDIADEAASLKRAIEGYIEELWAVHEQIARYENIDDDYAAKATVLYDTYTDGGERALDILSGISEFLVGLVEGAVVGLVDLIGAVIMFVAGVVGYLGAGIVYWVCEFTPLDTPDFIRDFLTDTNESIASILKDPFLIVESFAQGISDNFDNEGFAYGIGYLVPDVVLTIVGTKGIDKVIRGAKVVDNVGDVGSVARRVDVTKVELNALPEGWTKTSVNGFTHVRDETGVIRIRIDPPDDTIPYRHKHLYDEDGNSLDSSGNVVPRTSPDAHIPY